MARESTIRVLRSTGSTDPTGLTFGELAYTDANGKLFMGTTAGTSLWIGAGITTGGIATNSATLVPTQSAVKSYVDGVVGGGSVVNSFNGTGGAITLTGSGAILYTQSGITNTISARLATTGVTGVASFNSASFDVSAGADVTIKTGGVGNTQLANSSVTVTAGSGLAGGGAVSLGGSVTLSNAGVTGVVAGTGITVSGATGNVTITNTGVQSVNGITGAIVSVAVTGSNIFTGLQTMNAGITSNNLWVTNGVTFASGSYHTGLATFAGGLSAAGGATFSGNISAPNIVNSFNGATSAITLTGNGAILYSQSGGTNTISARLAGTGVTGVASFNTASFAVSAGAEVTIKSGGVSNAQLATAYHTISANGASTLNLGDTLTLTGGSNITLSNTANTVTLGLANDIVIAGNLTVNGTVVTANVDSFIAEDSMFALGTGNAADSLDIGFYGIYTNATQRSYSGLFRDASDGGKYKMYTGLTGTEPTTTVNTAAAGYAVATLVVNIDGGTF